MTAISKNVYFDVLDDIANKYNNTIHRTIKMKPTNVTDDSFTEYNEKSNKKVLNLKLVIMLVFLSIKIFLLKDTLLIGQRRSFLLIKLKIQFLGLILLVILIAKKLMEVFMKKNCKKLIKKKLEYKKYLKEKVINYMSNGKDITIRLIVGLIEKISYKNE